MNSNFKLIEIVKKYILIQSDSVNDKNSYKNAEEESKKNLIREEEKRLKLESFKKKVCERVKKYQNLQRITNENRDIKIQKNENQEYFDDLNCENIKNKKIVNVKIMLASKKNMDKNKLKCYDIYNLINFETSETNSLKVLSKFALQSLIFDLKKKNKCSSNQNERIITTRKVFSDLEREKAKKFCSDSCLKLLNINELKSKKEQLRFNEELDFENNIKSEIKNNKIFSINSKHNKYLMNEKKLHSFVPLCQCKLYNTDIECANNCLFYKNNAGS